ncbi:G-type lectin S-receptor-like serine/threonine-protein kinase CES101 [Telopea speciosissima]|uniref:G-type lectin S-receptor-like serine/threonine-protein kinase CES101 n=1 Tax=Telopea speciosissima TaxID=54955 RepID=UPI001CC3666D|nr:G-type lectin S-receptor-like serine/threonine-protein kinase CES101 [Telopea speciosissima]
MARLRSISNNISVLFFLIFSWSFGNRGSEAKNTLLAGESLRDGENLVSANKLYELKFMNFEHSQNRYLGILYLGYDGRAVWIANRENPLMDSSGILSINQGNLLLTNGSGISTMINPEEPAMGANTSATILDSGNLILKDGERIVWQSFDYPSDTFLPGMKLGLFGLRANKPRKRVLTSWLSNQVPSPGAFSLGVDPENMKELVIWRRGRVYWRSGIWDSNNFSFPYIRSVGVSTSKFVFNYYSNENQSYFTFAVKGSLGGSTWITMDFSGSLELFVAQPFSDPLIDLCENDNSEKWSEGCVMMKLPNCSGGHIFKETKASISSWMLQNYSKSLSLSDCKDMCRRNCSCTGYASADSNDGTGCFLFDGRYSGDLHGDYTLYLRNYTSLGAKSASENGISGHPTKKKLWLQVTALILIIMSAFLIAFIICRLKRRFCDGGGNNEKNEETGSSSATLQLNKLTSDVGAAHKYCNASDQKFCGNKDSELPLFSFSNIETATNNFSTTNKLGEGGFGPVYKGKLVEGQEIAVKRLSKMSGQGLEQFKNEVTLISKLQHRNLVRLLGCCIEGDEKILIYEYMPNKGLDSFLFDPMKRALLDWKTRVGIIEGIAQGLLYLHKYSRLRIIHRDLKASNVLLDCEMNPKISDFGTARIFGENESQANTNRVIGTFGYMPPEYAMDGLFSVKSDVFSFGVMMIEILSGKKNTGFYQADCNLNLLGFAWELWRKGKILDLMDDVLVDSCSASEFIRCVHVGFLCVQESSADRPTMSEVVSMLSNKTTTLPSPKSLAFTIGKSNIGVESSSSGQESVNDVTISEICGR